MSMGRPKVYGFCDVLVGKPVQTLPILVWNRVTRELREYIHLIRWFSI